MPHNEKNKIVKFFFEISKTNEKWEITENSFLRKDLKTTNF